MKKLLLLCLMFVMSSNIFAQIANGSQAPDFTTTDINGVTHNLQDYLNQGKTVILNVSATWCGPCWTYSQAGFFKDIHYGYGEDGSDEVVILYVEGDPSTGLEDLNGNTSNTQGDWVTGTPYPIIDDSSIATAYEITYFPTVYRICPDGLVFEMGQLQSSQIVSNINSNCAVTLQGADNHVTVLEDNFNTCFDEQNTQIDLTLRNYGTSLVNSVTIDVTSGSQVTQITENVSIGQFQEEVISLETYVDSSVSNSLEIVSVNGNAPFVSSFNSKDINFEVGASINETDIEVRVYTDNYPSEITWSIVDEAGNTVANGGPYQAGTDDNFGAGGPDANTTITQQVTLPDADACYSVQVNDSFGDGWSLSSNPVPPGIDIYIGSDVAYSTGSVGNFGTSKSYNGAFNYTTLSVEVTDLIDFNFYPNPSQGLVNFTSLQPFQVEIVDINGKLIYKGEIEANGQLDLTDVQTGVYLVKASTGSATKTSKLILK